MFWKCWLTQPVACQQLRKKKIKLSQQLIPEENPFWRLGVGYPVSRTSPKEKMFIGIDLSERQTLLMKIICAIPMSFHSVYHRTFFLAFDINNTGSLHIESSFACLENEHVPNLCNCVLNCQWKLKQGGKKMKGAYYVAMTDAIIQKTYKLDCVKCHKISDRAG